MKHITAHEFAFFIDGLSVALRSAHQKDTYTLDHKETITRITSVVRLKIGETCILFDRMVHADVELQAINKKNIVFKVSSIIKNKAIKPDLICLLPLLKKDDLAEAVTTLTACGVTTIQLIASAKVQRTWGGSQELERLERIMIASAEQSKYYTLPILKPPLALSSALTAYPSALHIFFDPSGKPLTDVIPSVLNHTGSLCLLVGPEGDFTPEEKTIIAHNKNIFCALTPTILRAHLAITLGAGIMRSLRLT